MTEFDAMQEILQQEERTGLLFNEDVKDKKAVAEYLHRVRKTKTKQKPFVIGHIRKEPNWENVFGYSD